MKRIISLIIAGILFVTPVFTAFADEPQSIDNAGDSFVDKFFDSIMPEGDILHGKKAEADLASDGEAEADLASDGEADVDLASDTEADVIDDISENGLKGILENPEFAGGSVDEIYKDMTPEARIAQMFMMQAGSWKGRGAVTVLDDDLKKLYAEYKFGGFISFADNMQNTIETLNLSKDLQAAVISRGGVPMIIATDQEGGIVQCIGTGTPMPGSMAVAATGDPSNACIEGSIISEELDALGYNCTLAPDMDINSNPGNPVIATRAFGDTPDMVAGYGTEFLEGLETNNTIGCIKHFAGHGDTDVDSRTGCPLIDKSWDELMDFELVPFTAAIEQGADMIMAAHIIYPQVDGTKVTATTGPHKGEKVNIPATISKIMLTDKLRGELGFDGVICTDSMGMAGISSILGGKERVAMAINAGADFICMPLTDDEIGTPGAFRRNVDALIDYIKENVPETRIEEAVKRILTLKAEKGILDYDESRYTEERALDTVGSNDFRQAERKMAADGVTLVRNEGDVLPLYVAPDSKVLMLVQDHNSGYHEKYAAQFVMGWNRAYEAGLIPSGASVDVVMFDESDWDDPDKLAAIDRADYIFTDSIVRYKTNMAYKGWQTAAPKKYTDYAREKGKKSFVISVDAPYDVQLFPNADGIFAVYNPTGSRENWKRVLENGTTKSDYAMGANLVAAIEVAFGIYGAHGTLPVNIYEFDADSDAYDLNTVVYERGFGIQYDPITSMEKAEINLEFTQAMYTGKEICPKVVVFVETGNDGDNKMLTEGKDYSVTYRDNINAGTATVEVKGLGSYFGSRYEHFEIISYSGGSAGYREPSTLYTGTIYYPVSEGKWKYDPASDSWSYTATRKFTDTWGYICNPWNNNRPAWFYFDRNGRMLTGWQRIYWNGGYKYFYFSESRDSRRGELLVNTITPDGYTVDADGVWRG